MPDAAVVKCSNCVWHQTIVQLLPSASEYYTCELAECRKYQPVRVVRRNGFVLRSYDVKAMKQHARELNAATEKQVKGASLSRQKVRLLEHMSKQAVLRLQELQNTNEQWPADAGLSKREPKRELVRYNLDEPPSAPVILTIENKWNAGKTQREVTAALKKMSAACMAVDGVYAFQYAVDEAKKVNSLTEVYKDVAAIGAMLAATASVQSELFGVITTTRTICSGPKAQVDAVYETLAKLGTEFFYTDAVSPAFVGFGQY